MTLKKWDTYSSDDLNRETRKHGGRFGVVVEIVNVPLAKDTPWRQNFAHDRRVCPDSGCTNDCGWTPAQQNQHLAQVYANADRVQQLYDRSQGATEARGETYYGGGDRRVLGSIRDNTAIHFGTNTGFSRNGICDDGTQDLGDCTSPELCTRRDFGRRQEDSYSSCAEAAPYTKWSDQSSDPHHGNACFKPGGFKYGGDWSCPTGCTKVGAVPYCVAGDATTDTKTPCRVPQYIEPTKARHVQQCASGTDCIDCGYCTPTLPEYKVVFSTLWEYEVGSRLTAPGPHQFKEPDLRLVWHWTRIC